MAGALPLMKTIATDVPSLKKKFEGVNAVYQVSARVNAQEKEAVHFIVENGEWSVKLGEYFGQQKIDAELENAHQILFKICKVYDGAFEDEQPFRHCRAS